MRTKGQHAAMNRAGRSRGNGLLRSKPCDFKILLHISMGHERYSQAEYSVGRAIKAAMGGETHILVVDDDDEIRALLSDYLERNGFRATAVADGRETRHALEKARFDLVILDLMLPHESGLEICRELRANSEIPVIMLTALREEVDRVVGLEVGADDYVTKPFSPRELLGRIRAVLRRTSSHREESDEKNISGYRFAYWQLNLELRTISRADRKTINLTRAEFSLLSTLLSNAPRVVTRAQLTQAVRGREYDPFDRSIDVLISRLRQMLNDDAKSPRLIRTMYGEGYIIGISVVAF
jgi:two-component system OmpR family response regulator